MQQKLTELKGEINKSTIMTGNFSILLSIIDNIIVQKQLSDTANHINLIGIYKTPSLKTSEYTFFSKYT